MYYNNGTLRGKERKREINGRKTNKTDWIERRRRRDEN
jgi:hypothetical protein